MSFLERSLKASPAPSAEPTLYLTSAGFFGSRPDIDGGLDWDVVTDPAALQAALHDLALASLPEAALLSVGVDVTSHDQRQWWFQGATGFVREVRRWDGGWTDAELTRRKVNCRGYTFLGFICGEAYEWPERQQLDALHDVDLVAVSAHVEVNRQWRQWIDPSLRRWAFQRRFQSISSQCGAALAQAHGADYGYVRNCDDWFVHKGELPFPGARAGTRICG